MTDTIDALRAEWTAQQDKLADALRINAAFFRDGAAERARAAMRRANAMGPVNMTIWIAFLIAFGAFNAAHWDQPKFLVMGVALHIWTIAMGARSIWERQALLALDFGAPVTAIQSRLAELRAQRLRSLKWAFLTGQIVWWIPFAIVTLKGLFDVDLYALSDFMRGFIWINLAVGLAFIPLSIAAAHALRPERTGWWSRFLDMLAGRDFAEAKAFAQRLQAFEREA